MRAMEAVAEPADTTGLVSRADLEASLDRAAALAPSPTIGLFGPESKMWEIGKQSVGFLGAGRAALLQLAHPYVAYGIEDHSETRSNPFNRFQRTFYNVFGMLYGDLETAFRSARIVHAVHTKITGEIPPGPARDAFGPRYRANEPDALLWVHATLWDTLVQVYELVVRRLRPVEVDRFYEETKRFAYLFGIPDAVIPPDWASFQAYNRRMFDTLVVSPPAKSMSKFLLAPMHPALRPLMHRYELMTAHLMPERLAEDFGLAREGRAGRRKYRATAKLIGNVNRGLPRRVRYIPAYVAGRRRIAGKTGPDPIGDFLTRVTVGSGGRR